MNKICWPQGEHKWGEVESWGGEEENWGGGEEEYWGGGRGGEGGGEGGKDSVVWSWFTPLVETNVLAERALDGICVHSLPCLYSCCCSVVWWLDDGQELKCWEFE